MRSFLVLYKAERIKLRRSWPMLAAVLIPVTLVGFMLLIFWYSEDRVEQIGAGFTAWYQVNFAVWNLFFFPAAMGLLGVLIWDVEGQAVSWKHLFLQPVPRWGHFAVKLMGLLSLAGLSLTIFVGTLLMAGCVLRLGVPTLRMGPIQPMLLARFTSASLVATVPLIAFHAWLPMRIRGLGANLIIAMLGTWLAFRVAEISPLGWFLPWGMSSQMVERIVKGHGSLLGSVAAALLSAGLFMVIGFLDFVTQEEPRD